MKYEANNLSVRRKLSPDDIKKHLDFLKEKFYKVETNWPSIGLIQLLRNTV